MMRHFLFLLALLALLAVAGPTAFAQTTSPPAETLPPLSTVRYSAEDSIRAVRHLFARRLRGGYGYVAGGSSILADAAVTTLLRPADTSVGQRIDTNQDWLGGSLMAGYGLFRSYRFSGPRCASIIAAYQQGAPLPVYVRRRLKTKFFRYVMR